MSAESSSSTSPMPCSDLRIAARGITRRRTDVKSLSTQDDMEPSPGFLIRSSSRDWIPWFLPPEVGAKYLGVPPSPDFSRHATFRPRFTHAREKRSVLGSARPGEEGGHIHHLSVGFDVDGKDYLLDLQLNRELIPKHYFQRHQKNGSHIVHRPTKEEVELCHYKGVLRGVEGSWAAVSTCNGLRGVVFDGHELHYLEPVSEVGITEEDKENMDEEYNNAHFLYKHSDLVANHTCGYSGTPYHIFHNQEFNRILRYKRSANAKEGSESDSNTIRGPYNANRQSRYVELVLVVDNKEYKELGESLPKVYKHCKDIANIINALYVPLNIFVALVGVVVWTEFDEIALSTNGDTTLTNFLHYRRGRLVKEHPNDNAQLLTRIQFKGGVVGKALKGPICTYEFSGGVSMDHSSVVGLVATTVAHEMGHNFGMEHDSSDCNCPSDRCIMAPSSSAMSPVHWSSCSLEYLALAFEHGMDYCLRNKPEKLFESPVCGNGFVEAGEQCDCGLSQHCDNPCCVADTCMLVPNTSCATGQCCDLKTCKPKTAGTMCRSADHECDLPEYCTGQSEYCPADVFKMDGETCDRGKAFCYQGSCRTHTDQCRLLWGPSGRSSDSQCYSMNTKGSRHGNCGYNRLNQSYNKCAEDNIMCGMLHCKHLNERLEFGMESVAILSHSFINSGGSIIPCRTAIVDLGLNEVDPGLAPDGAKCGHGKMCVNQKCLPVGSLVAGGPNAKGCPRGCNGNGVCNSKSHCHCHEGFAPPYCIYAGPGGSEDSGPASDPNAGRKMVTVLYVIFLGIVPLVAISVILLYYSRPCIKRWWEKGGGFGLGERRVGDGVGGSQYVTPDCCCSKWTFSWEKSKRSGAGGLRVLVEPSSSMSPSSGSGDSATSTLLPTGQEMLNTNLLGQFKRYSISPPKLSPSHNGILAPGESPPPSSSHSNGVVMPTRAAPPPPTTSPSGGAINPPAPAPSAPPHPGGKRPIISDPILDVSSSTAKELISNAIGGEEKPTEALKPQRRAPEAPPVQPRPLSFPVGLKPTEPPAPEVREVTPTVVTTSGITTASGGSSGGGAGGPSALSRIASILRPSQVGRSQSRGSRDMSGQGGQKGGVKAAKVLDRQALRNLSISNPIPQQEIEIPQKVLPISEAAAAVSMVGGKPTVARAQSMRDPKVTARPNIHTFGSMRGTRPASIPSASSIGTRPTSPPPRPPSPNPRPPADKTHTIPGLPGYQNPPPAKPEHAYDDCMSLKPVEETRGTVPPPPPPTAPLAHIEEEDSSTSPTSGDNIYAVIQEADDVCDVGKSPSLNLNTSYTSPTASEYQSPRPLEGSCESVGLLSEIVSEIQARNIESIYTSTLGRKKKQEEKERKEREEAEARGILCTTSNKDALGKPEKSVTFKMDNVGENQNLQGTYVNTPCTTASFQPSSSTFYSNVGNTGLPSSSASTALPPKTLISPPALSSSLLAKGPVSTSLMKNTAKASSQPPATATRPPITLTNTFPAIVSTPLPAIPQTKAAPITSTTTSTKAAVPPRPAQLPVRSPGSTVASAAPSEKEGATSTLASKGLLSPKSADAAKKDNIKPKVTSLEPANKSSTTNPKAGETPFSTFKGPIRTTATSPATTTLTSVPSYKPYSSSLQRSGGTVSSYRSASTPTSSTSTTPVSSAPSVSSPPPMSTASGAKSPPAEGNVENNRGIGSVNSGVAASPASKGPDLVTSSIRSFESASNIGKSPDVLMGAGGKGTVTNRQQQPRPAPKPNLPSSGRGVRAGVEANKGGVGITPSRGPAPVAPGNKAVGNTKPPVVSSRPSHVASLQQKFESSTDSNSGGKVAPKTEVMPHRTATSATNVSQKRPLPQSSKLESIGKGGGIKK
ncbi:uncharacterized protein LOC124153219 [Ischnura elegans]|uniref:uncharacterized protein LOC124153219 n=1 Tax=Ischnura elegans TaxID=197161 RepID=UPI001ED8A03D|nr:uncharacterized protein LOC124153219 [Ischnura elegans]